MDQKVKEAWVAALRSGKYKQGKDALRKLDNSFCALGVLYDVIDPEGWTIKVRRFTPNMKDVRLTRIGYIHKLSDEFTGASVGELDLITRLNDGSYPLKPHSFAEIADKIEKEL